MIVVRSMHGLRVGILMMSGLKWDTDELLGVVGCWRRVSEVGTRVSERVGGIEENKVAGG